MSLFASLMGDMDEDPFFMGGHMRQMNQMMSNFFRDPFQDMMVPMLTDVNQMRGGNHMHRGAANQLAIPGNIGGMMGGGLMPFGFPQMPGMPNIGRMFPDLSAAGHNGHISSMSTVMTMTAGPDGRPQVYQASTSTRQGPGGVRETKKTVSDSRTGVKKMSIGHHIYDRAHIIEREHNVHTGQQEEQQEFINLEEDEADEFNKEWETKTKSTRNAIGYGSQNPRRHRREREPQLALPSSSSPRVDESHQPSSSRAVRNARYPKSTKPSSSSVAARIAHSPTSQKRKNEETHKDEPKNKNRYYVNQDVVDIEEVEDDEEKAESDSNPQVVSDSDDEKNCSSDKE